MRNICTHAGWRESVVIWMCKLPAAIQAKAKEFELLLLFASVVNREVKGPCGGVLDACLEVLFLRSLPWLPCSSLLPAFSHCYTSSTLI